MSASFCFPLAKHLTTIHRSVICIHCNGGYMDEKLKPKIKTSLSSRLSPKRRRPALVTTISASNKEFLVDLKEKTGADYAQILDELLDSARLAEPVA